LFSASASQIQILVFVEVYNNIFYLYNCIVQNNYTLYWKLHIYLIKVWQSHRWKIGNTIFNIWCKCETFWVLLKPNFDQIQFHCTYYFLQHYNKGSFIDIVKLLYARIQVYSIQCLYCIVYNKWSCSWRAHYFFIICGIFEWLWFCILLADIWLFVNLISFTV